MRSVVCLVQRQGSFPNGTLADSAVGPDWVAVRDPCTHDPIVYSDNMTEYPALVADRIVEMGGEDYAGRSQDRSAEADVFVTCGGSSPA